MIGFLIHLSATVALLLWAVRLVRTGIERAFMSQVRQGLRNLCRNRLTAAMGGMLAAMLMQSGTAVTLIASGFIASAAIAPAAALVLIVGAELGSALMARVLFLPIQSAIPVLLLAGVILNFRKQNHALKQAGRVLIGLALILLALGMIRAATAPIAANDIVRAIAAYLAGDLLSAWVLGALLAWSMHSSLASVLTVASFAATGLTTAPVAAALVLGANFGGAIIPMTLLSGTGRDVRVVVTANTLARGSLAVAGLLALYFLETPALFPGLEEGTRAVTLHILFNLVLTLLVLPWPGLFLNASAHVVRSDPDALQDDLSALDPDAVADPRLGIACARRELMRMGETVQAMLVQVKPLYRAWDAEAEARILRLEEAVDRMHYESKLYISRLRAGDLSDSQSRQTLELVTVANGLEEAADRIAVNMLAIARKMHRKAVSFSGEGLNDLERLHDVVCSNAQLAMGVLTTGNPDDARQLVAQKDEMRGLEQRLQERHLQRLQDRRSDSVASTNMHQECLRLLKQINTSFTYAAYPILEEAGAFLGSRLTRNA